MSVSRCRCAWISIGVNRLFRAHLREYGVEEGGAMESSPVKCGGTFSRKLNGKGGTGDRGQGTGDRGQGQGKGERGIFSLDMS